MLLGEYIFWALAEKGTGHGEGEKAAKDDGDAVKEKIDGVALRGDLVAPLGGLVHLHRDSISISHLAVKGLPAGIAFAVHLKDELCFIFGADHNIAVIVFSFDGLIAAYNSADPSDIGGIFIVPFGNPALDNAPHPTAKQRCH